MEEAITLEELRFIVKAGREKEYRLMRFYAGFKGVNLDDNNEKSVEERFREIEKRAEARLHGINPDEIEGPTESEEFADFGIEIETID